MSLKIVKKGKEVCLFVIRGLVLAPSLFLRSFNFWRIGERAVSPVDFGADLSRCSFLYSPLRQTFFRGPPRRWEPKFRYYEVAFFA